MKKTIKKILSVAIAAVAAMSVFSLNACSKGGDTSGTLVIEAVQLGYGLDWLDSLANEWSAKTGNEVKIIKKIGEQGNQTITDEIESHASDSDVFIYRTSEYARKIYEGEINVSGKSYDCVYLDITDLCNKSLDVENGASISSKLLTTYKDVFCVNDKYYGLPWIEGVVGIMRNVDLWNKLGFTDDDIPLTTDQLFETCDKIKQATAADTKFKNVAPFLYSAEDEYYTMFMESWLFQYEGKENSEKFLAGKDPSGVVSNDIFTYQGQQEMFSVVEKLVKSSNGYQHPKSEGLDFTSMQGQFLKEQSVFCVNGAWIEIEMGSSYPDVKIDFIDTPIISSLVKKLSFYNEEAKDNDIKLREIVKYVDSTDSGYENKPSFATESDIDTVREARKYNFSSQAAHHVLVGSSYSAKTDMIKSFIEYMYSDKGMDCYYKATKGATLPFELSENGTYSDVAVSDFQRGIRNIDKNEIFVYASSAKMYSIGGVDLKFNNGINEYIKALANGSITASGIMQKNRAYMQNNWSSISSKL